MQTMKFRKLRIVTLVVFLILVSCVGYWLMYASSSRRPRSDFSQFHQYTDSEKHIAAQRSRSSRRKGTADEDADYVGLFRNNDRNHVNAEAKQSFDGQQSNDRDRFRQMEIAADNRGGTNSKQKQINAEHQAADLKKDEKYDDNYEDDQVDTVKDADTAAGVQQQKDDERGNELPPGGDEYSDNYEDDKEHPAEIDNVPTGKNSKQVSSIKRDHDTPLQLQFEGKQKNEDAESVTDRDMVDSRHVAVIDDERASAMEPKIKQRGDGAGENVLKWIQDRKQMQKLEREAAQQQQQDEWLAQQLHDGAHASHLRSHNIPPVPRVYGAGNAGLERNNEGGQQQTTAAETARQSSGLDDVIDNIDSEQPRGRHGDTGSRDAGSHGNAGSQYVIVHSGMASKVNGAMHPDLYALPSHVSPNAYIFTSDSLPKEPRQRPSVGNGYLATVAHGADVYVSGVYNGERSESHRAAIPSTCSFVISATEPSTTFNRTHELNVAAGIYSERMVSTSYVVTQRLYMHRSLKNVAVVEVDIERADETEAIELLVDVNRWGASYDLTFVTHDSARELVSYKVGTLNAAEMASTSDERVHVMYDRVPHKLVPPRNTRRAKWVFVTAVALSRHHVEQYYEEAKRRIHSNDDLFASHVRAWSSLWSRGRVDVDGDISLARAAYASWYYVLSSLPANYQTQFVGISPGGLPLASDQEWSGRVTYHQELWLFPSLLLFHSDISRHLISSRRRMMNAARRNAAQLNRPGAMLPWLSGATGTELSNDADRGVSSPFVSAGFVWAVQQSVYASNRSHDVTNTSLGSAVNDICHFLLSKVSPYANSHDFGVVDVVSLDESQGIVNNSPFINAIVKQALLTPAYVYALENKTTTNFRYFGDNIRITVEDDVYHPVHDGYRLSTQVSQSDAVLLGYPLQMPMSHELRSNDLSHYERFLGDSSPPTAWAMQTIGWVEVGNMKKANSCLRKQLEFITNNFQVWANTSHGTLGSTAYNYLPAMSTYLQSLVNGFAGVRLHHDRLDINPLLPSHVTSLHLVGVDYLGAQLNIIIKTDEVIVVQKSASPPLSGTQLRLCVFEPDELHLLETRREVRFKRRRAVIMSTTQPLPA